MTVTDFYNNLAGIIDAANKSFEEYKEGIENYNLDSAEVIKSIRDSCEKYKFSPEYSLRYIVRELIIAMIYDYMYEKKQTEKDGAE